MFETMAGNAHCRPDGHASPPFTTPAAHEIRFQSLFHAGRALVFPCDGLGHVNLDGLSSRSLCNYLFAKAMVGREFETPVVLPISN